MKQTFLLILLCLLFSCKSNHKSAVPTLLVEDAYRHPQAITTNDFVESFSYIRLETNPNCMVDEYPEINLTDDYVIIKTFRRCMLFDRQNGKYLRDVGHFGRDPGGFMSVAGGFFNENTQIFYFWGWKNDLLKYSLKGDFLGSVPTPFESSQTSTMVPERFDYTPENNIVCHLWNTTGTQDKMIVILDEAGKIISTVPNRHVIAEHPFRFTIREMRFLHTADKLLYNEIDNDTIFWISKGKPAPYLILARDKTRPDRYNFGEKPENIYPIDYFESQRFIMFNFMDPKNFFTLYDKSDSKLRVYKSSAGILNNTDSFVSFFPVSMRKEELSGFVQPEAIKSWFLKNQSIAEKLPEELKKLSSIELTDNPVIMIAGLKK